jgi:hypothetical protein
MFLSFFICTKLDHQPTSETMSMHPTRLVKGGYDVKRQFQQYFSYTMAGRLYWWRKLEYTEKTTD